MEEKALMQQSDSYLLLLCVSVCLINLFLTQEGMVFFLIFAVSIFVSYNNAQREPNKIIVTPDYEEHYWKVNFIETVAHNDITLFITV